MRGHLNVSNPDEWVALLIFLVSSLVSGQMAAILRTRAEEARQSEREMATLYELSTATAGQVEAGSVTPSVTPAPTPVEKAKKSPPGVGLAVALLIVGAAFWVSHWARSRRRRQPPPPD